MWIRALLVMLVGCSDGERVEDDPPGTSMEIVVRNEREQPVFLVNEDSCGFDGVSVADASGESVRRSAGQTPSCERTQGSRPCDTVGSCFAPRVRAIAPGERWTTTWDGRQADLRTMDPEGEDCPSECAVWSRVSVGRYLVEATAYRECADESCGDRSDDPELEASAPLVVGTDRRVELVFD